MPGENNDAPDNGTNDCFLHDVSFSLLKQLVLVDANCKTDYICPKFNPSGGNFKQAKNELKFYSTGQPRYKTMKKYCSCPESADQIIFCPFVKTKNNHSGK